MEDDSMVPDLGIVDLAGGSAMDAIEMHLVARGLLDLIDTVRLRNAGSPIPAPGIGDIPESIRMYALDAMRAAEACSVLVESTGLTADDAQIGELVTALTEAWQRADDARAAASRDLRRLAQIGLGVVQHLDDQEAVEFVERAVTGVLVTHGDDMQLADDEFHFVGTTRDEVSVELAGTIARLRWEERPGSGFGLVAEQEPLFVITVTADGGLDIAVGGPSDQPLDADRIFAARSDDPGTAPGPRTTNELTVPILDTVTAWSFEPRQVQVVWRK